MFHIYEVRQSNKGWSESYCFTTTKEAAEHICKEMKDSGSKNNFRVYKHECYSDRDLFFTIHQEYNIE